MDTALPAAGARLQKQGRLLHEGKLPMFLSEGEAAAAEAANAEQIGRAWADWVRQVESA